MKYHYNMGLNRRDVIKGLAAAFMAPAAAQAQPLPPPRPPEFPELNTALTKLAKKSDVILLADTDHFNIGLRAPLNDPSFLQAARKAGITDLYIEFERDYQPYAQGLMAGKITRDEFADIYFNRTVNIFEEKLGAGKIPSELLNNAKNDTSYSALAVADNILAAHRAGLKVHLADMQPSEDIQRATVIREHQNGPSGIPERINQYDPQIATLIDTTRKGKALVIYGALHIVPHTPEQFAKPGNIDDALRAHGTKTSTILLTSDLEEDVAMLKNARINPSGIPEMEVGKGVDIPDFVYSPEDKKGEYLTPGPVARALNNSTRTLPAPPSP